MVRAHQVPNLWTTSTSPPRGRAATWQSILTPHARLTLVLLSAPCSQFPVGVRWQQGRACRRGHCSKCWRMPKGARPVQPHPDSLPFTSLSASSLYARRPDEINGGRWPRDTLSAQVYNTSRSRAWRTVCAACCVVVCHAVRAAWRSRRVVLCGVLCVVLQVYTSRSRAWRTVCAACCVVVCGYAPCCTVRAACWSRRVVLCGACCVSCSPSRVVRAGPGRGYGTVCAYGMVFASHRTCGIAYQHKSKS
jgi:hypothetical protein